MFRTVYVLLTILGLLVAGPLYCTYAMQCTSGRCAAGEGVASGQRCAGCSSAYPPDERPGDRLQPEPEQPKAECDLDACRGSLNHAPRRPVFACRLLLSLASATLAPGGSEPPTVVSRSSAEFLAPPGYWPAAGHELCIAICSFLL